MSRNLGLAVGFFATVAVLVPAGWHWLDADVQSDGKRVRPLQQSFMVDGVRVTLDVDRNLIETGDKVKARLVAYSDKRKKVAVDLTVQHARNYEGERSEPVPTVIDVEKLTLEAAPGGGKPVETILRLGEHVDRIAMIDTFRIFVAKKGVRPDKGYWYEGGENDEEAADEPKDTAAVTVMGWSGNNLKLAIEASKPDADGAFVVTVRAKNTTHKALHGLWINLGTQVSNYGGITASDDFTIERIDAQDGTESYDRNVKRGRTVVERYKVTPQRTGLRDVTFVASATSTDQEIGPVVAGALDVKTVKLPGGSTVAVK